MGLEPLLAEFLPTSGDRFLKFWADHESTREEDASLVDLGQRQSLPPIGLTSSWSPTTCSPHRLLFFGFDATSKLPQICNAKHSNSESPDQRPAVDHAFVPGPFLAVSNPSIHQTFKRFPAEPVAIVLDGDLDELRIVHADHYSGRIRIPDVADKLAKSARRAAVQTSAEMSGPASSCRAWWGRVVLVDE